MLAQQGWMKDHPCRLYRCLCEWRAPAPTHTTMGRGAQWRMADDADCTATGCQQEATKQLSELRQQLHAQRQLREANLSPARLGES